jgi:hypothetical protein
MDVALLPWSPRDCPLENVLTGEVCYSWTVGTARENPLIGTVGVWPQDSVSTPFY